MDAKKKCSWLNKKRYYTKRYKFKCWNKNSARLLKPNAHTEPTVEETTREEREKRATSGKRINEHVHKVQRWIMITLHNFNASMLANATLLYSKLARVECIAATTICASFVRCLSFFHWNVVLHVIARASRYYVEPSGCVVLHVCCFPQKGRNFARAICSVSTGNALHLLCCKAEIELLLDCVAFCEIRDILSSIIFGRFWRLVCRWLSFPSESHLFVFHAFTKPLTDYVNSDSLSELKTGDKEQRPKSPHGIEKNKGLGCWQQQAINAARNERQPNTLRIDVV